MEAMQEGVVGVVKRCKNYILKLYDTELIDFSVETDQYGRLEATINNLDETKKHLLPMQLVANSTASGVVSWLEGRTLPKNRQFVNQILATAGLQVKDTLGIIEVCKGLSVNDSYWVDDGSEDVSFQDVNLFDNRLDETPAPVAYTGYTGTQRHKLGLSTEWTTDGRCAKAYRRIVCRRSIDTSPRGDRN